MNDTFKLATHNGTITVSNPKTGGHRTFKIRTQPEDSKFAPGSRVVSILAGPDNESDYQGFGFVNDDGRVALWKSKRTPQFNKLRALLEQPEVAADRWGMEYHFEGRCRRCNRTLTDPTSIQTGIGPVCSGRE